MHSRLMTAKSKAIIHLAQMFAELAIGLRDAFASRPGRLEQCASSICIVENLIRMQMVWYNRVVPS